LNRAVKTLLVATSLAPILLTYWFIEVVNAYQKELGIVENVKLYWDTGIVFLVSTVLLVILCLVIIRLARTRSETLPISIEEIKTADNESLGFILVYLLPLASGISEGFSVPILVFVAVLFFFIVMTSNSYHFNPLLNFFGFHFYEVKVSGGINYILLSRKNITNSKSINHAHQLTEYMLLEHEP